MSGTGASTFLDHPLIISAGNGFFKFRNAIFPVTFLLIFLVSRPGSYSLGSRTADRAVFVAGALLALAGQAFRLAVIGYAYIKRGGKEGKVYADTLVVRGFYAHTRNPMYVGNAAIAIGMSLIYGSAVTYFVAIPFFIFVYLCITATEEKYLRGRFGASFESYMKNVNRFIPNFSGLGRSLGEFRYDWKKAVRMDYGTSFLVFLGIGFVGAWRAYPRFGPRAVITFVAYGAVLLIYYGWARFMKKTGRLASAG